MAKSRRNRAKNRDDPIAKPAKPAKPLSDPELVAIRDKSILPVLKDLQSPEPKSRTAAAGAIASIIQDVKCRKLLLREKVVNIVLTETLTDAALESQAAGWEILRVLTAEEEADFCVHLYRLDVLTAIQHASAKVTGSFKKAEEKFIWGIAEALSDILSAVALSQEEALDVIVRNEQIVCFLLTLITLETTPISVQHSILSCMVTLSEDNDKFTEKVLSLDSGKYYRRLLEFKDGDGYKAVLACGVLHNVFAVARWNDQDPGKDGACDAILVPTLSQTLEHTQLKGGMTDGHDAANPEEILQLALEILASIGTALQSTLEQGSRSKRESSFKGFADNEDAMDADDGADDNVDDDEELSHNEAADDDDEMDQDEMDADMDMVTGADDNEATLEGIDDLPTLKELIQKAIPQLMKLSQDESSDEASAMIRSHALTALTNIAWTVSCMDFTDGSNSGVLQVWTPVAQAIWRDTITPILSNDTSDVNVAAIVTSLSWAISRSLHRGSFFKGFEHKKFKSLMYASQGINSDEHDPFQSLGVKCIGVLGQLACAGYMDVNRELGAFFLDIVKSAPNAPPADVVEALNQLFDIYGDESKEWEKEVFWKDNFLEYLEEAAPLVKAMVKTIDKRTYPELRVRAEEANLNLNRFIKYKKTHRP